MSKRTITNWTDFWAFYLGEHSLVSTRWMHFAGSSVAVALIVSAFVTGNAWLALVALIQGYAWAWVSHFFLEKNRPATFTYPLWSLAGDWKMWAYMLTGKLNGELARLNITPKSTSAAPSSSPAN